MILKADDKYYDTAINKQIIHRNTRLPYIPVELLNGIVKYVGIGENFSFTFGNLIVSHAWNRFIKHKKYSPSENHLQVQQIIVVINNQKTKLFEKICFIVNLLMMNKFDEMNIIAAAAVPRVVVSRLKYDYYINY